MQVIEKQVRAINQQSGEIASLKSKELATKEDVNFESSLVCKDIDIAILRLQKEISAEISSTKLEFKRKFLK